MKHTKQYKDRRVAIALFIVYNVEAERFDKRICTGPPCRDGSGKLPANAAQGRVAHRHAEGLSQRLFERARRLGIERPQLAEGERMVQRMPYSQVEGSYARSLRLIGGSLERPPATWVLLGMDFGRSVTAMLVSKEASRKALKAHYGKRNHLQRIVVDDPVVHTHLDGVYEHLRFPHPAVLKPKAALAVERRKLLEPVVEGLRTGALSWNSEEVKS